VYQTRVKSAASDGIFCEASKEFADGSPGSCC
jgi:hypothetical protein